MDKLKDEQLVVVPEIDPDDVASNNAEVAKLMAEIENLTQEARGVNANIDALRQRREEAVAKVTAKYHKTALNIQQADVELRQADEEASSELEGLALKHAQDLADLDAEDDKDDEEE